MTSYSQNWDGLPCDNILIYKYFQHLSRPTVCEVSPNLFSKIGLNINLFASLQFICDRLRPFLSKNATRMRRPLSVEKRVAITLWRMATNVEYRSIAHMFGVGRSTVGKVVLEVSQAITEHLAPEFIRIPHGDELCDVVRLFDVKWGFPQCFGAIDGSHIPIVAPDESPKDYYNRKGWFSLNIQALVDSRYRFMDLCIGWPGSVHDARVLSRSELYNRGEAGTLVGDLPRHIAGVDVPLLILGDAAYPLLSWLMTPYRDSGRLTAAQKRYNYRQSRARMVVENAFGRLKGRWRVLLKRLDNRLDAVPHIIMTCATLHNICETFGDHFHEIWREENTDDRRRQPQDTVQVRDVNDTSAITIRQALTTHVSI